VSVSGDKSYVLQENARLRHNVGLYTLYILTLCGLTSHKTHWAGIGLSGLVHEETHILVSLILLNLPLKALMMEAPTACWSS